MRRGSFGKVVGRRTIGAGLLAIMLAPGPLQRRHAAAQSARIAQVGILDWFSPGPTAIWYAETFRGAMRKLGYDEGRNLRIEHVFAEQDEERAAEGAAELLRRNVDVIVTRATPAGHAARRATATVPIVLATAADPVETGLVANLARPGGNVTGVSLMLPDLAAKRLQLLREAVPRASRLAFLGSTRDPATRRFVELSQAAAAALGAELHAYWVTDSGDFDVAFEAMKRETIEAVVVQPLFIVDAPRIADLAKRHALPTISDLRSAVRAGYLMSYGPDNTDSVGRAAVYVDKILKGTPPGELPIEQPTRFEMAINLATARTIGVEIPPHLVTLADEIVE
jgi:putative tryptophan/tyrosine transport system substrate-binding protein